MDQIEVGKQLREQIKILTPVLTKVMQAFDVEGIPLQDGGLALLFLASTAFMTIHAKTHKVLLSKEDLDGHLETFRNMLTIAWAIEATTWAK